MVTLDKVYHAAFVLRDVARKTDLIEAPRLSSSAHVYLKTENLQVTGSFKVRGGGLVLMENQKLVAEGAGAVSVAAVMFNKLPLAGKKVVCLVSGGNIDVNILSRVITRGLVMSGRNANLMIALVDKPGQLTQVSSIVSRCGGNVVNVHYDHADPNMAMNSCFLKLGLETRDQAQIEEIKKALTDEGFELVTERA